MGTTYERQKKLHDDVTNVGLRAQATAVGFVQLCVELRDAGVLSEDALARVKEAIANEVCMGGGRRSFTRNTRAEVGQRLDDLFSGRGRMGSADSLSFVTEAGRAEP